MLYTSAEANKLLRKLKESLSFDEIEERQKSTYTRALEEKDEDVRPEGYDLETTHNAVTVLQDQIRRLKHAINVFNVETEVPDTGMTIDQVLIYMPQVSELASKYTRMARVQPKTRLSHTPNVIDYQITNYDPADAKRFAEHYNDELAKLQTALDTVNNTVKGIEFTL